MWNTSLFKKHSALSWLLSNFEILMNKVWKLFQIYLQMKIGNFMQQNVLNHFCTKSSGFWRLRQQNSSSAV
jgi:hypothetical protein